MKNMNIRAKLFLGFAIVALLGTCTGIAGLISSRQLTRMSNELNALNQAGTSVSTVLNAHYIWRQGITETALSGKEFSGSRDPQGCALGVWLASEEAQNITDAEIISLIDKIVEPHTFIHTEAGIVIEHVEAGESDMAEAMLFDEILPQTQAVITGLTSIQQRFGVLADEKSQEIIVFGDAMSVLVFALIAVALIVSFLLIIYISRMISKPINDMMRYITQAGETGNLSFCDEDWANCDRISQGRDEIARTMKAFTKMMRQFVYYGESVNNVAEKDLSDSVKTLGETDTFGRAIAQMIGNFNHMFSEIGNATVQVANGSKQIADGAQMLAQGSTQQAATVEELSAAIAEIATTTQSNTAMAEDAAKLANVIKHNADKGSRQMDEMTAAVNEINVASQNISKVIKVIDDIAFQTNILALNAAVEAARAGQHGKGFAVVADEVRNLAAKSAAAAKDTGVLIANSMEKAELGASIAVDTAASLADIVAGINESSEIVGKIAASSEKQNSGITMINHSIDQVAQVVQQNSATAQQSAAASEELSSQSAMLEQLVEQFRLRDGARTGGTSGSGELRYQPAGLPDSASFTLGL